MSGPNIGSDAKTGRRRADLFLHRAFEFTICCIGIYASYLGYGLLHERLYTRPYRAWNTSAVHRFRYPLFLVFWQCLWNATVAFFTRRLFRDERPGVKRLDDEKRRLQGLTRTDVVVPTRLYALLALCHLVAMCCAFGALLYVPYPLQVLAKSSKMIPIMLTGTFLRRRRYSRAEVGRVLLITFGVLQFSRAQRPGSITRGTYRGDWPLVSGWTPAPRGVGAASGELADGWRCGPATGACASPVWCRCDSVHVRAERLGDDLARTVVARHRSGSGRVELPPTASGYLGGSDRIRSAERGGPTFCILRGLSFLGAHAGNDHDDTQVLYGFVEHTIFRSPNFLRPNDWNRVHLRGFALGGHSGLDCLHVVPEQRAFHERLLRGETSPSQGDVRIGVDPSRVVSEPRRDGLSRRRCMKTRLALADYRWTKLG
ncbi:hypothetical protein F1559_002212 [Cyanidiococcus yangmingshanensis]|uniref:Uncharacterized protein n=1 Tax=Cyanidiococcus yangmingshanensis TaxID=2690220 RepID=A0A7J7IN13_9RHOD|nr:hypothetical protein F1559_002212 [Cyanidiococcus yangmingshanensis]